MAAKRKLLIIDVAALGWELVRDQPGFRPLTPAFPAVTSPVQAAFRTGTEAGAHGLVSNGLFFPELRKVLFWEQAAQLVRGPRLWDDFRAGGGTVGLMFWQQSLGEKADLILSPAPIHKHGGGMIQDCYAEPRELQSRLEEKTGRSFNLMHYWGPLASEKSSAWIVDATAAVLETPALAPDLLLTYLPHLDYDLQRHGPESPQAQTALTALLGMLRELRGRAEAAGYDWLIFGDYAIEAVTRGAVFPNRRLREAGLFQTRAIRGMAYPDFFTSGAFAVVDHQVAHVYGPSAAAARAALTGLPGIAAILDEAAQRDLGIAHPERSGSLLLLAEPGAWFAYPWWTDRAEAPDYATHVDIHNKPGYDPCELFWGWPPPSVSLDTAKVRGTHGRTGPGLEAAWATSLALENQPQTLLELAHATRRWLHG